jgi:integrase
MGTIIVRGTKHKPRFYLRYTDADGGRKMRRAKGAIKMAHARRMLAEIERNLMNGKLGIEEPTEEEQARRSITMRELGEKFLKEYSDPGIKDLDDYRADARSKLTVRVYPILGDRAAAALTLNDLKRFRDGLAGKPLELAPASITLTLAVLSKMYTWANEAGYVDCRNPVKGCKRPRATPSLDYLSKPEVVSLLAAAEDLAQLGVASWRALMLHPMIATAVYAGLRLGELYGLRWTDVRLDAARLDVMRSYTTSPKSGKARHLPINAELVRILRVWEKRCPATAEGLVFPIEDGDRLRMGGANSLRGALPELLGAAGSHVPKKPWHALRHTFASHFMMAGGNILSLQKLLGHGTLTMTLIYAHLSPDHLAAEVARMSFAAPVPAGVGDMEAARRERDAEVDTNQTQQGTVTA